MFAAFPKNDLCVCVCVRPLGQDLSASVSFNCLQKHTTVSLKKDREIDTHISLPFSLSLAFHVVFISLSPLFLSLHLSFSS